MKRITFLVVLFIRLTAFSQSIGIGTVSPDASAQLDITAAGKGLLIPRVALTSSSDAVTFALVRVLTITVRKNQVELG